MGLFDKVKSVVRENLPDAVTNTDVSGQSDEMIHRFEKNGLISGSRLIVRETQEAIFMRNGEIAGIFGPGSYDLETDNVPIAKTILTMIYGNNPNAAEIWFINKSSMMGVGWGTPEPVNIEDTKFGFPVTLGVKCNGEITVKVFDSTLLFKEMAGLGKSFTMDKFRECIRGIMTSRLRKIIGNFMEQTKMSFIQMQNNITFLERPMADEVSDELARYGLTVVGCYVKGFKVVEDESWKRYKEYEDTIISRQLKSQLDAGDIQNIGQAHTNVEATRMQALGYDYSTGRQFDVMQTAAANEGNPMVNAPIGLGVGLGAGAAIGNAMGAANPMGGAVAAVPLGAEAPKAAAAKCPKCAASYQPGSKFCPECGYLVKKVCLGCGAEAGDSKFCQECGKKIVICSDCGSDTAVGATSCQKCGKSLSSGAVCAACGASYEEAPKFCAECGAKM